jgi:hypothetical protein
VKCAAVVLLLLAGTAAADPQPSLDDFYERTRERDDGFTSCIGYCDGRYLAALMVGAETANPSTDELQPELATGFRLGADLGIRGGAADIARSQLWADVLRVNATGNWITDLGWHTTSFAELGERGHGAVDVQLDTVLAHRTELQLSDVAELQAQPYTVADVEAEVAPTGPYIDKDTFLALPLGVATRLRWSDGMAMERRTAVSAAISGRGFPKDLRHHAQLDFVRIKYTDWDVGAGRANAWTLSTGYQHLPDGIDTLPIWALGGYEWAGPRRGVVAQIGGAVRLGTFEIGPSYETHFELDPRTAMFARVSSGKFGFRDRIGWFRYGVALEAISIEARGSLEAISPELGVLVHGVELGMRYRFAWTQDVMFPAERFNVSLDWQL